MFAGLWNGNLVSVSLEYGKVGLQDPNRGKQFALESPVLSLVPVEGNRRLFAGLENGNLVTVDLKECEQCCSLTLEDSGLDTLKLGTSAVRCLLHDENRILAGLFNGFLVMVQLDTRGGLPEDSYDPYRTDLTGGAVFSLELVMVAGKKRIFAGLERGELVCVELKPESVEELYRTQLHGGQVFSLLRVPTDERIFAGLFNGDLVSVDLSSGEVLSRIILGSDVFSLIHGKGERILAGLANGDFLMIFLAQVDA